MLEGVGTYDDTELMAEAFRTLMPENVYQIHGHRNAGHLPVRVNERVFNLEGQVEYGGCLRCLQVSGDGIGTFEIPNDVYRTFEDVHAQPVIEGSIPEMIIALRHNKYIQEKEIRQYFLLQLYRSGVFRQGVEPADGQGQRAVSGHG